MRVLSAISFLLAVSLAAAERPPLPAPEHVCEFKEGAIPEPSGLVLSPGWGAQGVFWTLPDSGSKAFIYSFDFKGRVLRKVDVMGAENIDWEEIAADDSGRLILADIGDNGRKRASITLYRLAEPDPLDATKRPEIPDVFQFKYPEKHGAQDAEGMVVWNGAAYLFTKDVTRLRVYRLPLPARAPAEGSVVEAEFIEEIEQPANVTGAALSEDGKSLALLTYLSVSVYELKAPPGTDARFFDAGNRASMRTRLTLLGQAEGVAWSGKDLIFNTEGGSVYRMKDVVGE